MRFTKRAVLAAALVAGVAMTASAQGQRQRQGQGRQGFGMGGGFGGPNVYMLIATNADLQAEVKVTDEQKTKIGEAIKPIQEKQRELRGGGGGGGQPPSAEQLRERAEKMAQLTAEAKKAVEGVLNPDQAKRLTQINYQALGISAYTNKDVEAGLKLTDGQKEKIKGIVEEFNKDRRELMQGAFQRGGGGDREEIQKRMQEMQKKTAALTKDATDKIEGLLKDDQKTAWKELTGAKFDTTKLTPQFGGQRRRDN